MRCPHCKKGIDDKEISAYLGSKGGRTSKREISKEAQAKMQTARKKSKPKQKKTAT